MHSSQQAGTLACKKPYHLPRAGVEPGKPALWTLVGALAWAIPNPARALAIEFDYRYDTRGFFTDTTSGEPLSERRSLLELAAGAYADFNDHLTAITPQTDDTWSVTITHPSLGGPPVRLTDLSVAADSIRVYVGGSPSAPGVLGFAGIGNLSASGSDGFVSDVFSRGQANTSGEDADDYGVWGGYIWFNAEQDWYFGADADGLSSGQPDFLTTATHELGHILGFGTADSWFSQIDQGTNRFLGSAASAVFGDSVPLDQFGSHWAEGVTSEVSGIPQETLMDPSTARGQRELMTELDYAGFSDIGWEVATVPAPASAWLFGGVLLGWIRLIRRPAC